MFNVGDEVIFQGRICEIKKDFGCNVYDLLDPEDERICLVSGNDLRYPWTIWDTITLWVVGIFMFLVGAGAFYLKYFVGV